MKIHEGMVNNALKNYFSLRTDYYFLTGEGGWKIFHILTFFICRLFCKQFLCLRFPANTFFYLHTIRFSVYNFCKQFISKFSNPPPPRQKKNGPSLTFFDRLVANGRVVRLTIVLNGYLEAFDRMTIFFKRIARAFGTDDGFFQRIAQAVRMITIFIERVIQTDGHFFLERIAKAVRKNTKSLKQKRFTTIGNFM